MNKLYNVTHQDAMEWAEQYAKPFMAKNEWVKEVTSSRIVIARKQPKTGKWSKVLSFNGELHRDIKVPQNMQIFRRDVGIDGVGEMIAMRVGNDAPRKRCLEIIKDAKCFPNNDENSVRDQKFFIAGTKKGEPKRILVWGASRLQAWIKLAIQLKVW
jgi:hypothetical protein